MGSCHNTPLLLVTLFVLLVAQQAWTKPAAEPIADAMAEAGKNDLPKLLLITDDIIPDAVENDTKKVIRVNPLELPTITHDPNLLNMDSSLFKIQTIKPFTGGQRKYHNLRRKTNQPKLQINDPVVGTASANVPVFSILDKPLKLKHQPKKKNLHFLYNQKDLNGNLLAKSMRVHVAPGAYPVYYVVSKTNGSFSKSPLKSFNSPQAFMKYLRKNKLEDLPALETYDNQ